MSGTLFLHAATFTKTHTFWLQLYILIGLEPAGEFKFAGMFRAYFLKEIYMPTIFMSWNLMKIVLSSM
jgi:hypothetical protein